jgi:hypothetical protein
LEVSGRKEVEVASQTSITAFAGTEMRTTELVPLAVRYPEFDVDEDCSEKLVTFLHPPTCHDHPTPCCVE